MRRRTLLAAPALLPLAARAQGTEDPRRVHIALLPDESPARLIQNAQPFKAYMERALDRPVELVVTTDYSSMIEAARFGRIHVAYFGPFSYVLARSRAQIEPFAVGVVRGSPTYTSVVVTQADGGIGGLAELRGKLMGYGDVASTSSHLVPRAFIQEQTGLKGGQDYQLVHLGTHDAVARSVQIGRVQAGALSRDIFASLVSRGIIDGAKVRQVAESWPIPNYPMTTQANLAPALKERIHAAILGMKDAEVLAAFRVDGFAPTTDAAYDVLRTTARVLELDLSKMS